MSWEMSEEVRLGNQAAEDQMVYTLRAVADLGYEELGDALEDGLLTFQEFEELCDSFLCFKVYGLRHCNCPRCMGIVKEGGYC